MNEPTEIIEQEEPEAVVAGSIVEVKRSSMDDLFWLSDNIDKIVEARKKIFTGILKLTIPGDFVSFGKDEKEKVELTGAACERIGGEQGLGMSLKNWTEKREDFTDEKGSYYVWTYEADACWKNCIIRVMSVVSSRDPFFGVEHGRLKEPWEIKLTDVKKAAYRGVYKEGVKTIFGLRHLNRADLEKNGVVIANVSGYTHKSKDEKAAGTQIATIEIRDVRQKSSKPGDTTQWTKFIIIGADLVEFNTFDRTMAELAKANFGKKATVNFTTSKYGNDLSSLAVE